MKPDLSRPLNRRSRSRRAAIFALAAVIGWSGLPAAAGQAPEARAAASAAPASLVFPGQAWARVDSPEAAGFTGPGIAAVLERVKTLATTGLVVVSDGRILLEYGQTSELSYLASVRKSVLAMLYGKAVADGKVRLDKTLAELNISDHGGLSDREREATVGDLLSARSGVYHPASNAGDNLADAPPRGSQKHGEYFLYSNWDFNVLGTIFEQETGRGIYDALEEDLARPLQMEDFDRAAQKKSGDLNVSLHPAYHIWLSTRDMARLGLLMLREGEWKDVRILPRDWVKRISGPVTRLGEMNPAYMRQGRLGYGYLWWVFDGPLVVGPFEGAYTGSGARGQFITVFPKLNLVVAHKVNVDKTQSAVSLSQYLSLLDALLAARKG